MARPYKVILLAAFGPLLYVAGLWFAGASDRRPLLDVSCFNAACPEHFASSRVMASIAMASGAAILLCFAPWWLGTLAIARRFPGKAATAHAWSLAGNTAMLLIVCFILRHTVGIGRGSLLVVWLLWTALLVGQVATLPTNWEVGNLPHVLLGIAAVAVCLVLFRNEIFLQCFNGDGTELYELARSLRLHTLPYWEIEPTGQFGTAVVNPLVTSSYWTLGFQLLLGEGELPTRLPYWIWWLGIYGSVGFSSGGLKPTLRALPLPLVIILSALWYTFYAGYDPYQGDIANPGVSDAMFTLWLLLGFDCLRQKDLGGWVACTVAAALVFYAGPVVFVLTIGAALFWQPVARRDMLRASLVGGSILVAILVAYLARGLWEGTLSAWFASFDEEWLSKYFHPQPRGFMSILFLGYFLLGCGVVPALGLIYILLRGSPWQRTEATVILAYLAIILGCGLKNLHYLGPLLPLTVTLWMTVPPAQIRVGNALRGVPFGGRASPSWNAAEGVPYSLLSQQSLLTTIGLALALWLCWPPQRPTFTLNRDLGQNTLFRTNDYAEACRWARIRSQLYQRGDFGWEISQHTWAGYAARGAGANVSLPLCVTDGGSPAAGYELVYASPDGAKFYCRDPELRRWLTAQQPLTGPQRFPWVFQPIAPKPETREPYEKTFGNTDLR